MPAELVFTPTDFVAVFNQTLEFAYPSVIIEGELADFRVNRNRWVYFQIKDETASLKFFGSVYSLPGPLEDGMKLRVLAAPRLHPQFGFSLNFSSIQPVGEGSIKKAADLLRAKLEAEGLFKTERKRALPEVPQRIGLITAASSAAAADFIKILNERWGGVEVLLADALVQGDGAAPAIVAALNHFEQISPLADVLVVTRGGGSADDLAAFNDERVVRAIAGSRTPTLVAIGHEVDVSLAELAADQRASTPTNAAQLVVPDRQNVINRWQTSRADLHRVLALQIQTLGREFAIEREQLADSVNRMLTIASTEVEHWHKLVKMFDPKAALKRGYAIIKKGSQHVSSIRDVKSQDRLQLELSDGKITATVE